MPKKEQLNDVKEFKEVYEKHKGRLSLETLFDEHMAILAARGRGVIDAADITAMSRDRESAIIKSMDQALKFRKQEIELQHTGQKLVQRSPQLEEFLGVSQTPTDPKQKDDLRKIEAPNDAKHGEIKE